MAFDLTRCDLEAVLRTSGGHVTGYWPSMKVGELESGCGPSRVHNPVLVDLPFQDAHCRAGEYVSVRVSYANVSVNVTNTSLCAENGTVAAARNYSLAHNRCNFTHSYNWTTTHRSYSVACNSCEAGKFSTSNSSYSTWLHNLSKVLNVTAVPSSCSSPTCGHFLTQHGFGTWSCSSDSNWRPDDARCPDPELSAAFCPGHGGCGNCSVCYVNPESLLEGFKKCGDRGACDPTGVDACKCDAGIKGRRCAYKTGFPFGYYGMGGLGVMVLFVLHKVLTSTDPDGEWNDPKYAIKRETGLVLSGAIVLRLLEFAQLGAVAFRAGMPWTDNSNLPALLSWPALNLQVATAGTVGFGTNLALWVGLLHVFWFKAFAGDPDVPAESHKSVVAMAVLIVPVTRVCLQVFFACTYYDSSARLYAGGRYNTFNPDPELSCFRTSWWWLYAVISFFGLNACVWGGLDMCVDEMCALKTNPSYPSSELYAWLLGCLKMMSVLIDVAIGDAHPDVNMAFQCGLFFLTALYLLAAKPYLHYMLNRLSAFGCMYAAVACAAGFNAVRIDNMDPVDSPYTDPSTSTFYILPGIAALIALYVSLELLITLKNKCKRGGQFASLYYLHAYSKPDTPAEHFTGKYKYEREEIEDKGVELVRWKHAYDPPQKSGKKWILKEVTRNKSGDSTAKKMSSDEALASVFGGMGGPKKAGGNPFGGGGGDSAAKSPFGRGGGAAKSPFGGGGGGGLAAKAAATKGGSAAQYAAVEKPPLPPTGAVGP